MNVRKVIGWRKMKKSLLNGEISRFLKFPTLSFWKIECFPIKKHLVFLTIKEYDVELKILDKNIVLSVGTRAPEGGSFLLLFKILLILAWNDEFMVYGNMRQSLTRKIGFRVISSFILILFYETDFFFHL